jgi:4-hydroxy-tetrahydrodipicolinate reductase
VVKIAVCGAAGRMGSAIRALALADKDVRLAGLVESKGHKLSGKTLDGVAVVDDVRAVLSGADVVIDFTHADAALKTAAAVAGARKALVLGTTGILGKAREELKAVKGIPVVWSANMSVSGNVLFDLAERLSGLLPDYDVEIAEVHHNQKKDAPSGTAQRLAEGVARARKSHNFVYGREGQTGARGSGEIGVHALRGGDVVGDHTVYFFGKGERIELVHRVTARDAFAHGALVAAKWAAGRKPGLYDMRDVLGLKKK